MAHDLLQYRTCFWGKYPTCDLVACCEPLQPANLFAAPRPRHRENRATHELIPPLRLTN
jgi:hypothetical protein